MQKRQWYRHLRRFTHACNFKQEFALILKHIVEKNDEKWKCCSSAKHLTGIFREATWVKFNTVNPILGTRTDGQYSALSAQTESCGVGHWTKKLLAATPRLCTTYVYGDAKNGYQYEVWPKERLQEWYVLCLYLQMAFVTNACITKLKISVRLHVFLLLCPV